jgi:hypothetical protein
MPVTVSCTCGKIFKVKDELAGTSVLCQICGKEVIAPAVQPLSAEQNKSPEPAALNSAAVDNMACPSCAESIPRKSRKCPFCGEIVKTKLSSEEQSALIQERISNLDAHLASLGGRANDEKIKGAQYAVKTIVLAVLAAFAVLMFVSGFFVRDGSGLSVFGFLMLLAFGIPALVSFINDGKAMQISDSPSADVAFRRFLMAVRTGRSNKAYVTLPPAAREAGVVETIKFNDSRIAIHEGRYTIRDPKSFKEYWKTIFTGPSGTTRTVAIKKVKMYRGELNGVAVVEAELEVTSYSSLLLLSILINLIVCLIVILIFQKKEKKTIRKLVIRRNGKWYFAEGELEGPLDKLEID